MRIMSSRARHPLAAIPDKLPILLIACSVTTSFAQFGASGDEIADELIAAGCQCTVERTSGGMTAAVTRARQLARPGGKSRKNAEPRLK